MKRALLLTYYLPPRQAIASVRAQHIVESLASHGWEVIPVVPQVGDVHYSPPVRTTGVVEFRSPVRRLLGVRSGQTTHERFHVEQGSALERPSWKQRVLEVGHRTLGFADGRLGWLGPGVRAVKELLQSERVDAIISTSPPVATHLVAARSHGNVPWIADLRDPWLRNDALGGGPILRAIDELLEGYAFQGAQALVTVSEPIAQGLRERYAHQRVYTIPNAFSSREWDPIPFVPPPKATFLHAGNLYRGLCNPLPFFEALAELIREGAVAESEVQVDLYGEPEGWLFAQADACGLSSVMTFHGRAPREEILRRERAASRLIIFVRNGVDERGTYTGKLFEYFGARRKILAVGGPAGRTVMDEALEETGAGERLRDVAGLRAAIVDAVREWRSGSTAILSEEAVAPFEVAHFGDRYAHVLEQARWSG